MIFRFIFTSLLLVLSVSGYAATNLRADSFQVRKISDNQVEFVSNEKILLINGSVITPVLYKDSESFSISRSGAWNQPQSLGEFNTVDENALSWAGVVFSQGDFNGDGKQDLFARSTLNGAENFIIYGASSSRPEAIAYTGNTVALNRSISVADVDGDGKDEIRILNGSVAGAIYDLEATGNNLSIALNTRLDYQRLYLGDSIGHSVKPASLIAPSSLNVGVEKSNGSLQANIDLMLPETDGPQPRLSIRKTSIGARGLLGNGWTLSGIDMIKRCTQLDNDKPEEGYCKNGRRLEKTEQVFFSDRYVYRDGVPGETTEFYKNFFSFHEYDGKGTEIKYGLLRNAGAGPEFYISSIKGGNGKVVSYSYDESNVLEKIEYDNVDIDFFYDSKSIIPEYSHYNDALSGNSVYAGETLRKIITKIVISVGGEVVSNYYLGYDTSSGVVLNSFQYCSKGHSGEECQPAYEFENEAGYQVESLIYPTVKVSKEMFHYGSFYTDSEAFRKLDNNSHNKNHPKISYLRKVSGENQYQYNSVDFNNYEIETHTPTTIYSDRSILPLTPIYGKGLDERGYAFIGGLNISNGCTWSSRSPVQYCPSSIKPGVIFTNGDNVNLQSSADKQAIWNLASHKAVSAPIVSDYDGDGLSDVWVMGVYYYNKKYNFSSSVIGPNKKSKYGSGFFLEDLVRDAPKDFTLDVSPVMDMDGDENPDVIVKINQEYYRVENNISSRSFSFSKLVANQSIIEKIFSSAILTDVNGDNQTDIIIVDDSGLHSYVGKKASVHPSSDIASKSNGTVTTETRLVYETRPVLTQFARSMVNYDEEMHSNAIAADLNKDGLSDILLLSSGRALAQALISDGSTFRLNGVLSQKLGIYATTPESVKYVDFDRDNNPELFEWVGYVRKISLEYGSGRLKEISYDKQALVSVEYNDSEQILASKAIVSPLNRYQARKELVSSLAINYGVQGWRKKSYIYGTYIGQYENYNYQGFITVSESLASSTNVNDAVPSEGFHNLYKNEYSDIRGHSEYKRSVFFTKVRTTLYKTSDDSEGDSTGSYSYESMRSIYQNKIFTGGTNQDAYLYFVDYASSVQNFLPVRPAAGFSTIRESWLTTEVDEKGRISKTIQDRDNKLYLVSYSYDTDFSGIPVSVLQRVITDEGGHNHVLTECGSSGLSACTENTTITELATLGGKKTALPASVVHFANTPELRREIKSSYSKLGDFYYVSEVSEKSVATNEVRTQILGIPAFGQPVSVRNKALSVATTITPGIYGEATNIVSPNGQTVNNTLDGLGRIIQYEPSASEGNSVAYLRCSDIICPEGSYFYQNIQADSGALARVFFDINGYQAGRASRNIHNEWSYSFDRYDLRGRIKSSYDQVPSLLSTVSTNYSYHMNDTVSEIREPATEVGDAVSDKVTTFNYDYKYLRGFPYLGTHTSTTNMLLETTARTSFAPISGVVNEDIRADIQERTTVTRVFSDELIAFIDSPVIQLYSYDAAGNNTEIKVTGRHASHNGLKHPAAQTQNYETDYDKAGNMIRSDRPGRDEIRHKYNAFGDRIRTTLADNSTIDFEYDTLGRIKTRKNNADRIAYSWGYDANFPGMLDTIMQYKHSSALPEDLSTADTQKVLEKYVYNDLAQVEQATKNINDQSLTRTYIYDTHGNISQESLSGGQVFNYTYTQDTLTAVRDSDRSMIWSLNSMDYRGRSTLKTYYNNMVYSREFEKYSDVLTQKRLSSGDNALDGENLFTDPLGNLRLKTSVSGSTVVNNDALTMAYDEKNRLLSVRDMSGSSDQERVFGYDDFGNFLYKDSALDTYDYKKEDGFFNSWISSYKSDKGTVSENVTYTPSTSQSEGLGNIMNMSGFNITYNQMGQPIAIEGENGFRINMSYGSADELLIVEYVHENRSVSVWGNIEYVEQRNGIDSTQSYYRYQQNAAVILRGDMEGKYLLYTDHLGSIRSVWNASGQLIGKQTFDAYGRPVSSENSDQIRLVTDRGYTGHLMVAGTPFIHMNARLYDYKAGIFTSADPVFADIQRTGGLNAYGYVYGNPFSFIDPQGLNGVDLTEYELGRYNIGLGVGLSAVDTHGVVKDFVFDDWLERRTDQTLREEIILGSDASFFLQEEYGEGSVALGVDAVFLGGWDVGLDNGRFSEGGVYGAVTADLNPEGIALGISTLGPELLIYSGNQGNLSEFSKETYLLGILSITTFTDSAGVYRGSSLSAAFGFGYYSASTYEGVASSELNGLRNILNPQRYTPSPLFDSWVNF